MTLAHRLWLVLVVLLCAPTFVSATDGAAHRPTRVPTLFIDATKGLKVGEVSAVIRSPNGLHILKVLGKRSAIDAKLSGGPVQQTRARHILLRVSDLTPEPEVKRRLEEFKLRIEAGQIEFATLARLHSVDPSGSRGDRCAERRPHASCARSATFPHPFQSRTWRHRPRWTSVMRPAWWSGCRAKPCSSADPVDQWSQ